MMRSITRRDSTSSSITSSTDSSSNYQTHPPPLLLSSDHPPQHYLITSSNKMKSSLDLPTDLKLGLSISTTANFSPRQEAAASDWPPRALMTTEEERTLSCQMLRQSHDNSCLFVKVIMEGIRIGRKIDVLALHGYPHLVTTLEHMFTTCNILWAELEERRDELRCSGHHHVLTYEDQDGDRMMVGDVPWEMFLTTVKRLKITRAVSSV